MPPYRASAGSRVALTSLRRGPRSRVLLTAVPPTTVSSSPTRLPKAPQSDVSALIRAECTDSLFSAQSNMTSSTNDAATSRSAGVLHTDRTVPQSAAKCLLNHHNSAAWLSVLPTLHLRGALTASDEAGARRYLAGPTYQTLLPWLWDGERPEDHSGTYQNDEGSSQNDWDADSVSLQDGIHRRLASLSVHPSPASAPRPPHARRPQKARRVDELRTAAPLEWREVITALLPVTVEARATASASREAQLLERLPQWHQVFFALSANPALNGRDETFSSAHEALMGVLRSFYQDAVAIQKHVSSPLLSPASISGEEEGAAGQGAGRNLLQTHPTVVCTTRMPPILLRRWRRQYRACGAYLLFSELFRACVEGEQAITEIMTERARAAGLSDGDFAGGAPSYALTPLYTTAVLQDSELFNFYLSIPGRREVNLTWEDQWQWTLSYAYVSFRWLFRMQSLTLLKHGTGSRRRGERADRAQDDAVEASWRAVKQALTTLLNVTVWVRNNNDEGQRCQEALRVVLKAHWDTLDHDQLSQITTAPAHGDADAHMRWERTETLLHTFRSVSWERMHHKLESLHFAPSRGLLDVATLMAVLEAARPVAATSHTGSENDASNQSHESLAEWRGSLDALLVVRGDGVAALWEAVCASPPCLAARTASRYALVSLGWRLLQTVLTAARAEASLGTAQRLLRELSHWVAEAGRPLRVCRGEVHPLWLYQLQRREAKVTTSDAASPPWLQTWHTLMSSLPTAAESSSAWVCGCGFSNSALTQSVGDESLAQGLTCASCVNRDLRPFTWECAGCHWVNTTGEACLSCLKCGQGHPARRTDTDDAIHLTPDNPHPCAHPHLIRLDPNVAAVEGMVAPPQHTDATLSCCADCASLCATHGPQHEAAAAAPQSAASQTLLHCCLDCGASTMATLRDSGILTSAPVSDAHCKECLGTRTYWRGLFTWHCGCGAQNHPSHQYCWSCTQEHRDGTPLLTCPDCQHEVIVTDDVTVPVMERGACTHCHHAHPRLVESVSAARLVDCPSCHHRMLADAEACPRCRSTLVRLVGPLLETEADQPWRCHSCGHAHAIRDGGSGVLLSSHHTKSQPTLDTFLTTTTAASPRDGAKTRHATARSPAITSGAGQACEQCHTPRLSVSSWEWGRPWQCDGCDGTKKPTTHIGFHCPECLQLAPGVPVEEVSCWQCRECDAWHPSWEATCSRFGCGASQVQSAQNRCEYVRWGCTACGEWCQMLPNVHSCSHCGEAARDNTHDDTTPASASASTSPANEARLAARAPDHTLSAEARDVLRSTVGSASDQSARQPLVSALAAAEQRLDDVETVLLAAANRRAPPRVLPDHNEFKELHTSASPVTETTPVVTVQSGDLTKGTHMVHAAAHS